MNYPCGPAQMTRTLCDLALEGVSEITQSGGFQSGEYPSGEDSHKYRWPALRLSIKMSRGGKGTEIFILTGKMIYSRLGIG